MRAGNGTGLMSRVLVTPGQQVIGVQIRQRMLVVLKLLGIHHGYFVSAHVELEIDT